MSNPIVHAFFVGRAAAELIGEGLETTLTNALSELGKFDAEQRENLRQFTEQVLERAKRQEEQHAVEIPSSPFTPESGRASSQDLQALIDDLRAEIAQVRAELQRYRAETSS
jgi:hypothetical protein